MPTKRHDGCHRRTVAPLYHVFRRIAVADGKARHASLVLAKVPAFSVQNDGKPVPK
jgi:hypothetical protein